MSNTPEKLVAQNELSQEEITIKILEAQKTESDIVIKILETQKAEKERVSLLEKRVDNIENTAPIPAITNKRLDRLRKSKVLECLGGKSARAYKFVEVDEFGTRHRFSQKVFREFAEDFYEEFNLNTYSDLQTGQVKQAEEYIKVWQPCTNTKRKIHQLNNQIELLAQ